MLKNQLLFNFKLRRACQHLIKSPPPSKCNCHSVASQFFPTYKSHLSSSSSVQTSAVSLNVEKCDVIRDSYHILYSIFKSDPKVRQLLVDVTNFDLNKVYRPDVHVVSSYRKCEMKFITNLELQEFKQKAQTHLEKTVQFDPVPIATINNNKSNSSNEERSVIERDDRLKGLDSCGLCFIDISNTKRGSRVGSDISTLEYSEISEHERSVWERTPDGDLKYSGSGCDSVKDRVIKSVYKKIYREPTGVVNIFKQDRLNELLHAGRFEFVINMAYQNYLIDDPKLRSILKTIYDYVCQNSLYDQLSSTKHYPLLMLHVLSSIGTTVDFITFLVQQRRSKDIVSFFNLAHNLANRIEQWHNKASLDGGLELIEGSIDIGTISEMIESFLELNKTSLDSKKSDNLRKSLQHWLSHKEHQVNEEDGSRTRLELAAA